MRILEDTPLGRLIYIENISINYVAMEILKEILSKINCCVKIIPMVFRKLA